MPGTRIRTHRQNAGLSQEKLAELVGVSRQAVAKWETGQSAPSTVNLLRLAAIFSTTVEQLLGAPDHSAQGETPSNAPQDAELTAPQGENEPPGRVRRTKARVRTVCAVVFGYLTIYLLGRLLWCPMSESSLLGWLVLTTPVGAHSYLYGWLLSSDMFWGAMGLSVLPAFFGRRRFSLATLGGFTLGLIAGILFGPYPEGAPYGHGDYGWAIWGALFLFSVVLGLLLERIAAGKRR